MPSRDLKQSIKRVKTQAQSQHDNFAEIVNTVLEEVDLKRNPRKKNEDTLIATDQMRMRFTSNTGRKGYGRETKAG